MKKVVNSGSDNKNHPNIDADINQSVNSKNQIQLRKIQSVQEKRVAEIEENQIKEQKPPKEQGSEQAPFLSRLENMGSSIVNSIVVN